MASFADYQKQALFCCILELDNYKNTGGGNDRTTSRFSRFSDFGKYVIEKYSLKNRLGMEMSENDFYNAVRKHWLKCSRYNTRMFSRFREKGSEAFKHQQLEEWGFTAWQLRMDTGLSRNPTLTDQQLSITYDDDGSAPDTSQSVKERMFPKAKQLTASRKRKERHDVTDDEGLNRRKRRKTAPEDEADDADTEDIEASNDSMKKPGALPRKRKVAHWVTGVAAVRAEQQGSMSKGVSQGGTRTQKYIINNSDSNDGNTLAETRGSVGDGRCSVLSEDPVQPRLSESADRDTSLNKRSHVQEALRGGWVSANDIVGQDVTSPISEDLGLGQPIFNRQSQAIRRMSGGEVRRKMDHIRQALKNYLGHLHFGLGDCPSPIIDCEPSGNLLEIYRTLFGHHWKAQGSGLILSRRYNGLHLIEGCIGAALWKSVWIKDLPWDGSCNASIEHYLDREQLLHAKYKRIEDQDFRKNHIQPIATELAEQFMVVMQRQFLLAGIKSVREEDFDWAHQTRLLTDIFLDALIFKGELKVMPDKYEFEWTEHGEVYDRETMAEVVQSEGDRKVAWCLLPRIRCYYERENAWRMDVKSQVYTMRA